MAAPVNGLSSILKIIYDERFDKDALARTSSLMASIAHKEDFTGERINWSMNYAGLGGRSADAAKSEANDVNNAYAQFTVTPKTDYIHRTMMGRLVRQAMKGDISSQFVDYAAQEMISAQESLNQNLARGAYASRTGKRGTRGSLAGNVLTLAEPGAALYFNIGDKLVAGATDGGALRAGTAALVTGVDSANNTVTSAQWGNITSFADGDSLYVDGDLNALWSGLGTACPLVAPTSGDAVYGADVDRSANPEMLAGVRLVNTGSNIETVLIQNMAYLRTRPGTSFKNAKIFCSEIDFASIQVAKEGSRFIDSSGPYEMGIEAFKVGSTTIVPDVFCPQGTYFVIGEGAFELHTVEGVHIDGLDGNTLRKTANDTYKFAALVDGDFTCPRPNSIARGVWPNQ